MVEVPIRFFDINQALKNLKKLMNQEGVFKVLRLKRHYLKPSVKTKLKREEASRRRYKNKGFKQHITPPMA